MNKRQLIEWLEGIPDTAKVYIETDHGQQPEQGGDIYVVDTTKDLPYYGEELDWVPLGGYKGFYDKITAVLLR